MLQVVVMLVEFASPVIFAGLAITCFVEYKIILGVAFSIAFILWLGIATYDWWKIIKIEY